VGRYTARDIDQLRIAVAEGLTGNECAAMLQRSPLSIRAKCCALGLRLRREQGEHELRFQLTKRTHAAMRAIAKARATSPSRVARLWCEIIVRDGLAEQLVDRVVFLKTMLNEPARAAKRVGPRPRHCALILSPR
jgi:hypothetical protein